MATEFIERIQAATAQKKPLCIQGGATKTWYGQEPQGEILSTRAYSGIIDYDPTELVITARCGTPLSEIKQALAEQHQFLAFEPPSFGMDATIGGAVATGLAGPRRAYAGGVRDFVLGAVLLNGSAERLTFGGQVMKNVAGYDVSRMLAGSMGFLGLLLELSIKVLPVPQSECTLRFELTESDALTKLNQWGAMPLPISASSWESGQLSLRLSGSEAATSQARQQLGGEQLQSEQASQHWLTLNEQTASFFQQQGALWRLSLPSTCPSIALGAAQLIEWGGAQRWLHLPELANDQLSAHQLRLQVAALGGHATLFKGGDKKIGVFQPLPQPLFAIHQRLKSAFDPAGIFNPGRLYSEL
jgi:glycolate oxidase FAD binding subunit